MRKKNQLLLVFLFIGIHGLVAQGGRKGDQADFSRYETFTTVKGEFVVPKDERSISDDQFYEWMKAAVIRELELRGYRHVEDSMAHFKVSYVAGAFNVNKNEDMGPMGGTPASDPAMADQSRYWSQSYRQGMLVIEVFKGRSKDILWSKESNVDLTNINVERAVSGVVAKAFKKFPKKPKTK